MFLTSRILKRRESTSRDLCAPQEALPPACSKASVVISDFHLSRSRLKDALRLHQGVYRVGRIDWSCFSTFRSQESGRLVTSATSRRRLLIRKR